MKIPMLGGSSVDSTHILEPSQFPETRLDIKVAQHDFKTGSAAFTADVAPCSQVFVRPCLLPSHKKCWRGMGEQMSMIN